MERVFSGEIENAMEMMGVNECERSWVDGERYLGARYRSVN